MKKSKQQPMAAAALVSSSLHLAVGRRAPRLVNYSAPRGYSILDAAPVHVGRQAALPHVGRTPRRKY